MMRPTCCFSTPAAEPENGTLAHIECQRWQHMPPKAGHFSAALRPPLTPRPGSCTPKPMPSTDLPEVLVGFGHQQNHLVSKKPLERTFYLGGMFSNCSFLAAGRVSGTSVASLGYSPPTVHTPGRGGKEEPFTSASSSSSPTGAAGAGPRFSPRAEDIPLLRFPSTRKQLVYLCSCHPTSSPLSVLLCPVTQHSAPL